MSMKIRVRREPTAINVYNPWLIGVNIRRLTSYWLLMVNLFYNHVGTEEINIINHIINHSTIYKKPLRPLNDCVIILSSFMFPFCDSFWCCLSGRTFVHFVLHFVYICIVIRFPILKEDLDFHRYMSTCFWCSMIWN